MTDGVLSNTLLTTDTIPIILDLGLCNAQGDEKRIGALLYLTLSLTHAVRLSPIITATMSNFTNGVFIREFVRGVVML